MDYKEIVKKIPILGSIIGWMNSNDIDYGTLVASICIIILVIVAIWTDISFAQILIITVALGPIWITYLLFTLFHSKWMDAVGKSFSLYNGRTTLRIKLPPEVQKSPEAMEFVLSQIHNVANSDNLMQTFLQGKRPLNFAFEIVSIGGDVRFYANLPTKKTKPAFEANMYAQYPGVEIVEEEVDYAAEIPIGDPEWVVMSFHMRKKKPQEFPIKTYLDYGHDKMPKEEEKVDPITPMLEVLGSIGPNERIYVQFIAKSWRVPSFKGGEQLKPGEGEDWTVGVEEKISEMMNRDPKTKTALGDGGAEELARLTAGERDTIEAMERNAGKYAYKTGIRWMYMGKEGHFQGDMINPIIRSFSQYDIIGRNAVGVAWRTDTHYKDFVPGDKAKIAGWKKQEHKEYKARLFYNKNGIGDPKIFTTEELATMWHLPGKVAITPNLGRIGSTRSEAPSNLPIGNLPT